MALPNIFSPEESQKIIHRIHQLTPTSTRSWGKMDVATMLAHCNVTYELAYEKKHPVPSSFTKMLLKLLVKNAVVSDKPYQKNSRTGPPFVITDTRDFDTERKRLVDYITHTQQLGEKTFEGKESHSFGTLTSTEWSNMFYKHLDHHLSQFGV